LIDPFDWHWFKTFFSPFHNYCQNHKEKNDFLSLSNKRYFTGSKKTPWFTFQYRAYQNREGFLKCLGYHKIRNTNTLEQADSIFYVIHTKITMQEHQITIIYPTQLTWLCRPNVI